MKYVILPQEALTLPPILQHGGEGRLPIAPSVGAAEIIDNTVEATWVSASRIPPRSLSGCTGAALGLDFRKLATFPGVFAKELGLAFALAFSGVFGAADLINGVDL